MAKDEYKVEAYDCSQPMNIKMFDRAAHCRFNPEVEGVPEKVSILQHVNSQMVGGYKCQVNSHRNMYYCGLWSYSKPIARANISDHSPIVRRNGTLPPICNSPGTEYRDIGSPWANLHHGVLCRVPNSLKLRNKMPRYRYLDRGVNPDGHSYTYGVCSDNRDRDVFSRRIRDKSSWPATRGLRRSIAHLLMEPTGGQLYLQED